MGLMPLNLGGLGGQLGGAQAQRNVPFPDGGLAGFLFGNRQPMQTQGWQPGIQGGRYTAMQPQWQQPMNPLTAFLGGGFGNAMNNVRMGGYQPPANGMTPWGTQVPQRQHDPNIFNTRNAFGQRPGEI